MQETSVRKMLEEREGKFFSAHAMLSCNTRGRLEEEPEDPYRTAFQRDRDRIIHSKAFRRLKLKTQVFLAPQDDHYRTRLTHTLEVSQIARTVARALMLNEDLTEAIALGHDLGHTPFGHAGERVLNALYAPGFSHSEQSLRVVDLLEKRHDRPGLNLTWEVRDGIRYHSEGKALLHARPVTRPETLEGRITSLSDAIAYMSHDIDDALRAGIIGLDDLPRTARRVLGENTSERIDSMVVGLIRGSQDGQAGIQEDVLEAMVELRRYLYTELYPCEAIHTEIGKAEWLLEALYHYLVKHPLKDLWDEDGDEPLERRVVDFIASMTDEYALRLCEQLLLPAPWKHR